VHGLRCYGNVTRTRNVSEYMLVLALRQVYFCGGGLLIRYASVNAVLLTDIVPPRTCNIALAVMIIFIQQQVVVHSQHWTDYKNSSVDEIANVDVFYDDIVHVEASACAH